MIRKAIVESYTYYELPPVEDGVQAEYPKTYIGTITRIDSPEGRDTTYSLSMNDVGEDILCPSMETAELVMRLIWQGRELKLESEIRIK